MGTEGQVAEGGVSVGKIQETRGGEEEVSSIGEDASREQYIPIYFQQDAILHSFLYLETALHVLGVTSTHHQERIQLYLQHLVLVTQLLLPAAIVEEVELRCRYSCTCS